MSLTVGAHLQKWNTWSAGARIIFNACSMFLKLGIRTCDWEKWYAYSTACVHFAALHSRTARVVHWVYTHFTRIWRACNTKLHAVDLKFRVILHEILELEIIEWVQWGQNIYRTAYLRSEERPPHPGSLPVQNILLWCFKIAWPNTWKWKQRAWKSLITRLN